MLSGKTSEEDLLDRYLDLGDSEERGSRKAIKGEALTQLIYEIFRHKRPLLVGLAMVVLANLAAVLEPRIFASAIDDALVPGNFALLRKFGLFYLSVTSLRVLGVVTQQYWFEVLGQRVSQSLRVRLFSHLQRIPVQIYDKNPAGRLLTRVTNDISALGDMFSAGFVNVAGNSLLILGTLLSLFLLDFRLALISAGVFPLLLLSSFYFGKKLAKAYREERSKLSALNAFLAENILGIKTVHLFNRQKLHLSRFDRINQWYADAQFGTIRIYALFQPIITLASGLSIALVVWFAGGKVGAGHLKIGILTAFFSYVLTLFQPLREIADNWNTFLSGMASAERIFSILKWATEVPEGPEKTSPVSPLSLKGQIEFENVWFAYHDRLPGNEHWVLKDVSFKIEMGTQVGVVGHTGAGKTTLISLMLRFYEPQKGRILMDGKDIRTLDKRALRAAIGIVQQDVFLFSGTVEDNLTFWDPHTPLPDFSEVGLDFKAGLLEERGSNLSSGQRQVLSFARAYTARPHIWILDEATANMDSETEKTLQLALKKASQGKTTILIAHRLSTVKNADLILVLNQGALVESGTHAELLQKSGLYARLYRYQRSQETQPSSQTV